MSSGKGKPLPDEMNFQDVEQRLNQWKTNIDDIKRSYLTEAVHIGDVETRLDAAQQKLYNWIANVQLMQEKQKLLDQELDFMSKQQDELAKEVSGIDIPQGRTDSSIASTVDDISDKLASLNMEISKRSNEDVKDTKITIAKILNAQLSALEILTRKAAELRKDMAGVHYDELEELGFEN